MSNGMLFNLLLLYIVIYQKLQLRKLKKLQLRKFKNKGIRTQNDAENQNSKIEKNTKIVRKRNEIYI